MDGNVGHKKKKKRGKKVKKKDDGEIDEKNDEEVTGTEWMGKKKGEKSEKKEGKEVNEENDEKKKKNDGISDEKKDDGDDGKEEYEGEECEEYEVSEVIQKKKKKRKKRSLVMTHSAIDVVNGGNGRFDSKKGKGRKGRKDNIKRSLSLDAISSTSGRPRSKSKRRMQKSMYVYDPSPLELPYHDKKEKKVFKKYQKKHKKKDKHLGPSKAAPTPGHRRGTVFRHKKNVLGEIIYKKHPSWLLMQNIQTALRYSVGGGNEVIVEDDELEIENNRDILFHSPPVLRFPPKGSPQTPSHNAPSFKFKDYCPKVFKHIRQKFGIDEADYMCSLCNTLDDGSNALREMSTPGKSGSLFLFSSDMSYILKTIPKREAKVLRSILPAYYNHVIHNHDTLLPRFFGLHRIKPHHGRQVRFVVMGNIFLTNQKLHLRYDLKGSEFGRQVTEEQKNLQRSKVCFKDLDWMDQKQKLRIGSVRQNAFLKQLKTDCELLESLHVMDYSLLIGIHDSSIPEDPESSHSSFILDEESLEDELKEEFTESKSSKPRKSSKSGKSSKSSKSSKSGKSSKPGKKKKSTLESKQPTKTEEKGKKGPGEKKHSSPNKGKRSQVPTKETNSKESDSSASDDDDSFWLDSSDDSEHSRAEEIEEEESQMKESASGLKMTDFSLPARHVRRCRSNFQGDEGGMRGRGKSKGQWFFVGVIDILMPYTTRKSVESVYKKVRFRGQGEISAVNPKMYSRRFQSFIAHITE